MYTSRVPRRICSVPLVTNSPTTSGFTEAEMRRTPICDPGRPGKGLFLMISPSSFGDRVIVVITFPYVRSSSVSIVPLNSSSES